MIFTVKFFRLKAPQFPQGLPPNTVDSRLNRFFGVLSGVRKMLFRMCKNKIFALRIRPEFLKSTALGFPRGCYQSPFQGVS
ncbi:Uncharacterized protein dnm_099310 [Desulfonema magnum]|uniref:Uncharacterized protein n=1 Tax=Desulfonema magnum TaxID=45655 RepID=A0A975GWA4_9BACT|nr:Uncharacterized protein dnm_099310 [Desulfonema magnum]